LLQLGAFDQDIPKTSSHLLIFNLLEQTFDPFQNSFTKIFILKMGSLRRRRKRGRNLSQSESNILDVRFAEKGIYLFEKGGLEKLELLHPGRMRDIDEKDLIPDGARLGLESDRFAHDLLPGPENGVSFQGGLDLQGLQSFL